MPVERSDSTAGTKHDRYVPKHQAEMTPWERIREAAVGLGDLVMPVLYLLFIPLTVVMAVMGAMMFSFLVGSFALFMAGDSSNSEQPGMQSELLVPVHESDSVQLGQWVHPDSLPDPEPEPEFEFEFEPIEEPLYLGVH